MGKTKAFMGFYRGCPGQGASVGFRVYGLGFRI